MSLFTTIKDKAITVLVSTAFRHRAALVASATVVFFIDQVVTQVQSIPYNNAVEGVVVVTVIGILNSLRGKVSN